MLCESEREGESESESGVEGGRERRGEREPLFHQRLVSLSSHKTGIDYFGSYSV